VTIHVGRHRAPGYSPITELTQIATDSVKPAVRMTSVAVVSGGLIAGMAVPASAVSSVTTVDSSQAQTLGAVVTAPSAPAATESYGSFGFKVKKVAAPAAAATAVSRSTTRAAAPAAAPAAAAPAAAPAPVAVPAPNDGTIIGIAKSLYGIPYRYGGTTTAGFDCSGFTQYVYRQAGISIARTAEAQRQGATKVSNPQPGDLVFWGIPATHVGIYAGPGMIIDSASSGTRVSMHKIWSTNITYGRY